MMAVEMSIIRANEKPHDAAPRCLERLWAHDTGDKETIVPGIKPPKPSCSFGITNSKAGSVALDFH